MAGEPPPRDAAARAPAVRASQAARPLGARRIVLGGAGVVLAMVLIAVAYARMPAADVGITDALVGFVLVAGAAVVLVVLFLVGLRAVPKASRPLLVTISMLLVLIEVFVVLFAYVYLSLEAATPGSVPGVVTHLDAVYFVVTMLATVGFGDITPASQVARAVATFQMLFNLVLLGAVVRLGVAVGREAAQRKVRAEDPRSLPPVVREWETDQDVSTPDGEGTS